MLRKSAFSVYAETKPEYDEIKTNKRIFENQNIKSKKAWNTSNPNKKQQQQQKSNLNGKHVFSSTLKDANHHHQNGNVLKRQKGARVSKRAQKKFDKLPAEKLTESISLFSAAVLGGKELKKRQQAKQNNSPIKITKHANQKLRKVELTSKKASKNVANFAKLSKNLTALSNSNGSVDSDFDLYDKEIDQDMFDSRKEAANLFKKIISPVSNKDFFGKFWEKEAMLIKRSNFNFYKSWFSCSELDKILRCQNLDFTTNIDVTTYVNDEKKSHSPEGKAYAPIVWDFFQQGCSIRLLNPSTYSRNIWRYLSLLQELFGTCVGSNVYLTPAGTQGFAPHYDDIEAFVLQLEGRKRWRVYKPLQDEFALPRFSSGNYSQDDLKDHKPIIDVILEPGDLLYFPRGFIHQANALDDIHSLHITVSCYQKNSWGDFLQKLLPSALEHACADNLEFRQGLPINYQMTNGIAYEGDKQCLKDRSQFKEKCERLVRGLVNYLPIDAAVDQMAKEYIHESLPPCFTQSERSRSIHGHGEKWNEEKNRVEDIAEMEPDTAIKLIRRNCLRLVVEEDSCLIYHNLDNGKVWKEREAQYLECEVDAAPAIEYLIRAYPRYVTVEQLPMGTDEEKITVASCLYDKGLLVTGEPLECNDENKDDDD
jgi:lysine-specific demethylase/histidyl-hydroxylase NO66